MHRLPGVEDIFPDRIDKWNFIINTAREAFRLYNFKEIVIPVMEYTEVFARGIGDATDIVSKEMFTFEDRGGRSLTLRPEGTASVVRAYTENGDYNRLALAKFFYVGPMFRAERPQKGRLRQFNQFGAELFGSGEPYYDYEIIALVNHIAVRLGIENYSLLLNSVGCPSCRAEYISALKAYYADHENKLCRDCRERLRKNAMRLLDCKNENCIRLKQNAPIITDFLDAECKRHYEALKRYLTDANIVFREDPYLVRGLDYYTRTAFEFVSEDLGGQNAFAAGGRYDNLVEQFGGKSTPGIGFAAGVERLLLLTEKTPVKASALDVFVMHTNKENLQKAVLLTRQLRAFGISADMSPNSGGLKSQFKRAERDNAMLAAVISDDGNSVRIKRMETGEQIDTPFENTAHTIAHSFRFS